MLEVDSSKGRSPQTDSFGGMDEALAAQEPLVAPGFARLRWAYHWPGWLGLGRPCRAKLAGCLDPLEALGRNFQPEPLTVHITAGRPQEL